MALGADAARDREVPDPRLDDRIVDLLRRAPGAFAFNGLRRALAAHPESLTRALRRLERLGVIARGDRGYALLAAPPPTEMTGEREPLRATGSVDLAAGISGSDLIGHLAGRWFGALRWVGVHERPGDPLLVWSVEGTDGHVFLGVRRGSLRVYVDRPHRSTDAGPLERAARELLAHALQRLDAAVPDRFSAVLEMRLDAVRARPIAG